MGAKPAAFRSSVAIRSGSVISTLAFVVVDSSRTDFLVLPVVIPVVDLIPLTSDDCFCSGAGVTNRGLLFLFNLLETGSIRPPFSSVTSAELDSASRREDEFAVAASASALDGVAFLEFDLSKCACKLSRKVESSVSFNGFALLMQLGAMA